MLALFGSVWVGCYLAWNRLQAFRVTAQVARKRETTERDGIEDLRKTMEAKDKRTWQLIWWQLTLVAGGILLMLVVALAHFYAA